jgi:DmsE family decaheme c-type cytochrome
MSHLIPFPGASALEGTRLMRLVCHWLLVLLLAFPLAGTVAAGENKKSVAKDILRVGDARCTRCHNDVSDDEIENYPVLPIGRTKHGTVADSRTPTCVACHGESESHLKQIGTDRPLPERPFGKKAASDPKVNNKACMACHEGDKLMHWAGSLHARRDVPCSGCHQIHAAHDKATTRTLVVAMCISCHTEKRAQINRPYRHPVVEGSMVCIDCHNPHGSAGPKMMVKDSVNETCYTCHMDYRGPFLWSHPAVRQDCSLCHNPHGSTVSGLLKMRAPFLCQQCHEPANHRGNFPGLDNTKSNTPGSSGLTQARACMNCHTNLHGGSNPANANSSARFRR